MTFKGQPWFNVGRRTFALVTQEDRAVLKLERGHQELLFEIRPETFQRFPVATVHWARVELAHLEVDELAALVREAWSTIVPKKVSRPYFAALDGRGVS